jgi:hypothetical protein
MRLGRGGGIHQLRRKARSNEQQQPSVCRPAPISYDIVQLIGPGSPIPATFRLAPLDTLPLSEGPWLDLWLNRVRGFFMDTIGCSAARF